MALRMRVLFLPCYLDGLPVTAASARIRAQYPAKYWEEADVYPVLTRPFGDYDVYIFQKLYLTDRPRAWAKALRAMGKTMVFDMCDADWLQSETHEQRLLTLLPLFDFAVSPSHAIREWLSRWLPAYFIPDRFDLTEFTVMHKIVPGEPPDLVWFGYVHNIDQLETLWPIIQEHDLPLTIVSNEMPAVWVERGAQFVKWTREGANREIVKHNIALVPQTSAYKSNNRTTTAALLGLVPVHDSATLIMMLEEQARNNAIAKAYSLAYELYGVSTSVAQWKGLLEAHSRSDHNAKGATE